MRRARQQQFLGPDTVKEFELIEKPKAQGLPSSETCALAAIPHYVSCAHES